MPRKVWAYDTGNEQRKDALARFLKRNRITHEILLDPDNSGYEHWLFKIPAAITTEQVATINNWLNTH